MYGWAGKILYVNLTTKEMKIIPTEKYADKYIGGFGIGVAIYWDMVASKGRLPAAYDPQNVVCVMNSPFSGTPIAGSGRCEIVGKGPMPYPESFTRSGFGGRFAAELKFAGWDGIAVQGAASSPCWIYIENDHVEIRDAKHLWGLKTGATQAAIYAETSFGPGPSWKRLKNGTETTQEIKVLCCGPAGEQLCRDACLIHEGSNGAGQGGFGAVFGSKNLKAIGVIGTGSVKVADPKKLLELRKWAQDLTFRIDDPKGQSIGDTYGSYPGGRDWLAKNKAQLSDGCFSCSRPCKQGLDTFPGWGSQMHCMNSYAYRMADQDLDMRKRGVPYSETKISDNLFGGALLLNQWGLNAAYYAKMHEYTWLYDQLYFKERDYLEKIAPGFEMESYGTIAWFDKFLKMIVFRENELGRALAEGWRRGPALLGRYDQDIKENWLLPQPYHHGYPHHRDPRAQYQWGLGTILWARDINEHGQERESSLIAGADQAKYIKVLDEVWAKYPSSSGIVMTHKGHDQSDDVIYTKPVSDMVSYYREMYNIYQSLSMCCFIWPLWTSPYTQDGKGATPEYEVGSYNALTGKNETWTDLMKKGRRINNLVRAILVLDGKHRDQEVFSPYIYDTILDNKVKRRDGTPEGNQSTIRGADGKFSRKIPNRSLSRDGVEKSKDYCYQNYDWDLKTGWPTRKSLEDVDLKDVADVLERTGKLGK